MKNILLISADFPHTYYQFAKAFKENGMNVFVIGGTPYDSLRSELRNNVTRYYQCGDMENLNSMINIVGCIINEFGPIDFLESNNEYWLRNDSVLREWFGISSGIYPHQLDDYQKKSSMKKYYEAAGVKVAPYLLVRDFESLEKFAEKFGYPLFAKPDIGVGAGGNYKIKNKEELVRFFDEKPQNIQYICEVFVKSSNIVTFDGIADANSDAVYVASMNCPPSLFELKERGDDMFYYYYDKVDPKLEKLGRAVVKAMGLKNRFFHSEFFVVSEDLKGYFKKGDYVGIEVNIRTPGGYTPDMQDFALSTSVYDIFADIVCFGKTDVQLGERFFLGTASRRYEKSYFYSDKDIFRTFKNEICFAGDYPFVLSDIMGDKFYMGKFKNPKDLEIFRDYVAKRNDISTEKIKITHTLAGEDARMMREKNSKSDLSDMTICDKHIDGA